MKKKFRKIIVDGDDSWAWIFYSKGDYHEDQYIKIWKDKKVVFDKNYSLNTDFKWSKENKNKKYKITPKLISRFIKIYLKK